MEENLPIGRGRIGIWIFALFFHEGHTLRVDFCYTFLDISIILIWQLEYVQLSTDPPINCNENISVPYLLRSQHEASVACH